MVNIIEFDASLKLTWVRKLITHEHEWSETAKWNQIDRLPLTGEKYHQSVYLSIQNPFWKRVLAAYMLLMLQNKKSG